jgi:DNA-binding Xre family transcriptional regulator
MPQNQNWDKSQKNYRRILYNVMGYSEYIGEASMTLKESIANRIYELCVSKGLNTNSLANLCGIDPSTIYSILGAKSKSPEVATIKKICDGLEITLGQFFSTPEFDNLEQEIK